MRSTTIDISKNYNMPANKRDFSPMINDKPKTNLNAYKGKTIILLIS